MVLFTKDENMNGEVVIDQEVPGDAWFCGGTPGVQGSTSDPVTASTALPAR